MSQPSITMTDLDLERKLRSILFAANGSIRIKAVKWRYQTVNNNNTTNWTERYRTLLSRFLCRYPINKPFEEDPKEVPLETAAKMAQTTAIALLIEEGASIPRKIANQLQCKGSGKITEGLPFGGQHRQYCNHYKCQSVKDVLEKAIAARDAKLAEIVRVTSDFISIPGVVSIIRDFFVCDNAAKTQEE